MPMACARQLSMVESTVNDHLTLDSDSNVCAGAKQKVSAVSLWGVMDTGSSGPLALSNPGTQ